MCNQWQLVCLLTNICRFAGIRPGSHYGENHDDGDGNVYGDGKKRGESVTLKLRSVDKEKMASTLLLWIHLLSLFRYCVHPGLRRNRHRGTSFVVHRQQAWRRSRRARLRSEFNAVLLSPPFQELARSIRTPQRFWAATRERGIWDKDVCLLWKTRERMYPDWEGVQY